MLLRNFCSGIVEGLVPGGNQSTELLNILGDIGSFWYLYGVYPLTSTPTEENPYTDETYYNSGYVGYNRVGLSLYVSTEDTDVSFTDIAFSDAGNELTDYRDFKTPNGLTRVSMKTEPNSFRQLFACNASFRNDSENDITVRKIGVSSMGVWSNRTSVRDFYGVNSSNADAPNRPMHFLIAASKLSTPVTIHPGETYNFRYEVTLSSGVLTNNFCQLIRDTLSATNVQLNSASFKDKLGNTHQYARLNGRTYTNNTTTTSRYFSNLIISDSEESDMDEAYNLSNIPELSYGTSTFIIEEDGLLLRVSRVVTNNSANSITVRIIAIETSPNFIVYNQNYYNPYQTFYRYSLENNKSIVAAKKLDTPVTIAPGESYSFTYEIRVD